MDLDLDLDLDLGMGWSGGGAVAFAFHACAPHTNQCDKGSKLVAKFDMK